MSTLMQSMAEPKKKKKKNQLFMSNHSKAFSFRLEMYYSIWYLDCITQFYQK